MDQELEAGTNFSPRLVTAEMWATLLNSILPFPMPVTPMFVQHVFNVCTIKFLPPSIPFTVALLLHYLCHVPPLEGWMGKDVFLVTIAVVVKSLCEDPPLPSNFWWSFGYYEVETFNCMEVEFCQHLDWHIVFSGPELELFSAFIELFMIWL